MSDKKPLAEMKSILAEKVSAATQAIEALSDTATTEEIEAAEALAQEARDYQTEVTAAEEAETARTERLSALRTSFASEDEDPDAETGEGEGDDPDPDADDADKDKEVEASAETTETQPEAPAEGGEGDQPTPAPAQPVAASTRKAKRTALASTSKDKQMTDTQASGAVVKIAADVEGFAANQVADKNTLNLAVGSMLQGMSTRGFSNQSTMRQIATIRPQGLQTLSMDASLGANLAVIESVTDPSKVQGAGGAQGLVAAGGWCSPSENVYDLVQDASTDGILSLPETQVQRGGFKIPVLPSIGDFLESDAHFEQTEAQAIAGETKSFGEVDCPTWEEFRLEAVGVQIRVPILTEYAFPELINYYTDGVLIAHQHKINRKVISKMEAQSTIFAGEIGALGAVSTDTFHALELVAEKRRAKYLLPLTTPMEAVLPHYVKGILRSDIARRNGVGTEVITDAHIAAEFAARNIKPSYVYDWQSLDATGVTTTGQGYPATFKVLMYPAGTFVKGGGEIINLRGVYDSTLLETNQYTGLFAEQALLVARVRNGADVITIPTVIAGATGAQDIKKPAA